MRMLLCRCFSILLFTLVLPAPGIGVYAQELVDPMKPPAFALMKMRQAKQSGQPVVKKTTVAKPKPAALQLTSILFSANRKIAIIDDQMLAVGDTIRGAKLVKLTRTDARLVRKGKVIKLSLGNDLTAIKRKSVESDL